MMGYQNLLHVGALSVRLSEGFLVLMVVWSVRSSCVLYLVVVSMVALSQAILCPVVREWWAGADWLWEKSSGLCKCSLILLYHRLESILFIFNFVYKMDNIIEYYGRGGY